MNCTSRSAVRLRHAVADPLELDVVAPLEGGGERLEVLRVHLHGVGVAGIAHHLIAALGNLAADGGRPIALHRLADERDRPAIGGIHVVERLQRRHHLLVIVAVGDGEDVPAIGGPLVHQVVAGELGVDHAADQRVVDAGVVVGDHHAEPLADLHRQRLRLQLLRVAFGHRELALEGDDLRAADAGAHHVPEGGLARGRRHADAGRAAVHVVGDVDALGVAGQRLDAAQLGLREERMAGEPLVLEQRRQRAGAAAKAQRVNRQHRDVRIHVIARVAGGRMAARHRLAHDHPQRVARRDAVPAGQHELVAEGVLGPPVVEPQAAQVGPGQVRGRRCRACRRAGRRSVRSVRSCPAAPGSCTS